MKERLDKVKAETVSGRIKYLQDIIERKIPLEKGNLSWLDKPCDISTEIKKWGGIYEKIGKGCYGKIFKVCIDKMCNYEFALKEIKITDTDYYPDNNYPYRAENIEVKISNLLNTLVYKGITPHILLNIGDFNCIIKNKEYRYLMMEKADRDLDNVLFSPGIDVEILRNCLFQILYTIKVIQMEYPDFIHNDLKPCNILCFDPDQKLKDKFYKYTLLGEDYYIPESYRTAIWDFGISSINCENCNNAEVEIITLEQITGLQTEKNHYKDIFKLFKYLSLLELDNETRIFIQKYIVNAKHDNYANLIENIEPFSIEEILKDSYFGKYRKIPKGEIIESFSCPNFSPSNSNRKKGIENRKKGIENRKKGIENRKKNIGVKKDKAIENINCSNYISYGLWYLDYKKDKRYNDPYRENCLSAKNSNSKLKPLSSLDFTPPFNTFDTSDISMENLDKIKEIYTHILKKFTETVNIPTHHFLYVQRAVLRKAIFIVLKRHLLYLDPPNIKFVDCIIQLNKFLCSPFIS